MDDLEITIAVVSFLLGSVFTIGVALTMALLAPWIGPQRGDSHPDEGNIIPIDRTRHRRNKRHWRVH